MNIILIFIIILFLCILSEPQIQHFLITFIYANIAPTDENNVENKKMSDDIFIIKKNIEDKIKLDYTNDCNLQKVKTYNYKDIVDKLDINYFSLLTNNYTLPVLIKNVYDNEFLKNYNINNILSKYGNVIVEAVLIKPDGKITSIIVPLKEYIKKIENGEKYYLTVNNSLANSLDITLLLEFYNKLFDTYGIKNIFLGNKHSSTHLHCELASSCAIQLSGIKKWYLVDPKYSEHLHPIPDKNKIFYVSSRGFLLRNNKTHDIPHYEIIAEEGDFLFVPSWWWHETLNLTDHNLMFSYRPTLFEAPFNTNLKHTLLGIKNSIGYNKYVLPLLVKSEIIDIKEDVVVNSLKEIKARMPSELENIIK
jgi:hypothetical protein